MTVETLLHRLAEAAADEPAPPWLADRALQRTTRRRRTRLAGAGLVVVVAAGTALAARPGGGPVHETPVPSGAMRPTIAIGEHVIWDSRLTPQVGDVVELRHDGTDQVKRVRSIDPTARTLFVVGDDLDVSYDSRQYGPVSATSVLGVVTRIVDTGGHRRPVPGAPTHADSGDDVDPAQDPPPAAASAVG